MRTVRRLEWLAFLKKHGAPFDAKYLRDQICARSYRALRDGFFKVGLFQALRARLRSNRPSGTEPFRGIKPPSDFLTSREVKECSDVFWPRTRGAFSVVPEGRSDRSLARSAWDRVTSKEPSRKVRSESRRYAHRFDDLRVKCATRHPVALFTDN
jgi:hypothetical protein